MNQEATATERQAKISESFRAAKRAFDDARDKLASAQSDFIGAERRYHEASRAYTNEYFSEPPKRG